MIRTSTIKEGAEITFNSADAFKFRVVMLRQLKDARTFFRNGSFPKVWDVVQQRLHTPGPRGRRRTTLSEPVQTPPRLKGPSSRCTSRPPRETGHRPTRTPTRTLP